MYLIMHVYVFLYAYMYMLIFICLCAYTYMQKHLYICSHTNICICISEMNDRNVSTMGGNNLEKNLKKNICIYMYACMLNC